MKPYHCLIIIYLLSVFFISGCTVTHYAKQENIYENQISESTSMTETKNQLTINIEKLELDADGELPDYLRYNNFLYRFEKNIDITEIELNKYQLLGQVNEDVFDLPQNDLSSNFLRPGVELYRYSGNEILAVLYYEYVYNDVTRSHDLKILEEPKGILLMEENSFLKLYE